MISRFCNLWFIITMLILSAHLANAKECVAAYDFGQGSSFYIGSNPNKEDLIFSRPANNQVAPWTPTNFTTLGSKQNIKIRITGAWTPWGMQSGIWGMQAGMKECTLQTCDPQDEKQAPCLAGGMYVEVGEYGDNIPCQLSHGWGLYGLIAIDRGNERADPNSKEFAKTLPTEYFRTFRVAPVSRDGDGDYFELDATKQCALDKDGKTVCVVDTDEKGNKTTLRGSLYFKIVDSNYEDNDGEYVVTVLSGVAGKKGIAEEAIEAFTKTMHEVTEIMFRGLTGNLGFISMIRAFLVAYVVLSGLLFMMGMLRMHISELLVRLFKLGIVATLISQTSWEFFNTYLFSFFTVGAQNIATIITKAAFTYSEDFGVGQYILPENAHAVSVFDNVLNMLISPSLHKKILGMLFHKIYYFVYMIFIYVCIGILMLAIVRSVMLYIVSIMLVALLLVISPIFLIMILFQLTKELFDAWLKQLLSNALLLIVVSVAMAIMVNLVLNQLEKMLYYKVCWDIVWSFKIGDWTLFDIWFWKPDQPDQLDRCLTPLNFFSFLLVCVLFNAFMQEIPSLIDSLASAALMPVSRSYGAMLRTFEGSAIYRKGTGYVNEIRSLATPSVVLLPFEGGRAILRGRDEFLETARGAYSTVEGKYLRAVGGSGIEETDVLQWPRDKVGGFIERVEGAVKPKNRGIFD